MRKDGVFLPAGVHVGVCALATLLCLAGLARIAWGAQKQTSKGAIEDPRVEELYRQAKAAEAAGDLVQAAARYQSMLAIAPSMAAAYNNLGALYIREREYQKAAENLQKALKLDSKLQSASALLGIAKYEMADYAEAQPYLEKAVRANSKDTNAGLYLAKDLIQLAKYESGAVQLQKLSQLDPDNQEVWYLLGKLYMKMSENALMKLNAIDPESVYVHEVAGEMMESMNNFDGALIEYKKAVELAPQKPGMHVHLANAYWTLKLWDAAAQEFQAELANDPRNCEAHWKLGNIRLEQHEEPKLALDEIEQAVTLCPNMAAARVDRARVYLQLNRNEEAETDLLVAEKADPSDTSTHFLLAQVYRRLGRSKDAQAEMQAFSKLEEANRSKTANRAQEMLEDKSKAASPQP